jgi:hypothetical protein
MSTWRHHADADGRCGTYPRPRAVILNGPSDIEHCGQQIADAKFLTATVMRRSPPTQRWAVFSRQQGWRGICIQNAVASEVSRESRAVEIRCCRPVERRTVLVQRGLYTTVSQVRQCQLRCPPPPRPRPATCRRGTWFAPSGCPLGHRLGGWVMIHLPAVVCTNSPRMHEA